jgi:type IV pilus assembly protein PilZ
LLTLLDDPERFAITGKVVWINSRTTPGGRQIGVGIQFSGAEGANLQKKIASLMAGYTRADQPTNTM